MPIAHTGFPDMPELSFVIPTYNRVSTLVECLHALDEQDDVPVEYEVIVVDDGSQDDTASVVETLIPTLSMPLLLLRQQNAGPATARNRGVSAARGRLIGFLGDDIVVERSYVRSLLEAYRRHDNGLHGVLGLTRYRQDCVPTPFGRWLDRDGGFQFEYHALTDGSPLAFDQFYTSNVLLPRSVFERAGGFDDRLRRAAFEDTDLGYRLARLGFVLYFCPHATAVHVHAVSLHATAERMRMAARALQDIRSINSDLFATLYPDADALFGHPSIGRRVVRWLFSGPAETIADMLDWRGVPLPHAVYARILRSAFSHEMSILQHNGGSTMDGA